MLQASRYAVNWRFGNDWANHTGPECSQYAVIQRVSDTSQSTCGLTVTQKVPRFGPALCYTKKTSRRARAQLYVVSAHSGQMQPDRTTAHIRASTVPPVPSALAYQQLCMYHLVSFIVRSVGSNCGCVVPSHTQTRAETVPIDSRTVSKFPNCVHVTHADVRIYFAPVAATVLQHSPLRCPTHP